MYIEKGWGYWDINKQTKGKCFVRVTAPTPITILQEISTTEARVQLPDGTIGIVQYSALRG